MHYFLCKSWKTVTENIYSHSIQIQGFLGGSDGKDLPVTQETQVWFLGWEDPLEDEMAAHSGSLA